jgi:hypothetical protein
VNLSRVDRGEAFSQSSGMQQKISPKSHILLKVNPAKSGVYFWEKPNEEVTKR